MKALITGSAGFVGRHFRTHLERSGWDVEPVDILGATSSTDALWFFKNVTDKRYDLVIHAAARGPNRRAIDLAPSNMHYNTMLDAAMFDWAIRTRQPHVVYLSSAAVYSDELMRGTFGHYPFVEHQIGLHPFDRYGEEKRYGELMADAARACGVQITVVRPFTGYGSDQSEDFPFGAFIQRAVRREDPFHVWGSSTQVRDFIHIDDVVKGTLALVDAGVTKPVNLCTGVPTTMLDLAVRVIGVYNELAEKRYDPVIEEVRNAPMGVRYRVGNPDLLHTWYAPTITVADGVRRALREALEDE